MIGNGINIGKEIVPLDIKNAILEIFLPATIEEDIIVLSLTLDGEYLIRAGPLLVQGLAIDLPSSVSTWI